MVIDDEVYDDYLGVKVNKTKDGKYVVPSTIVKRNKKREEDDFEDEDIFEVKRKKKSLDPFEVEKTKRKTQNRHYEAPRRKSSR